MSAEAELILWMAVTFTLLITVLVAFVRKPIVKGLLKYSDKVREDLTYAEKTRTDNVEQMKKQEEMLEQTKRQAEDLIEDERRVAEKICDDIISGAKVQAKEIIELAHKEIEHMKASAIEDMKRQLSEMAIDNSKKIISKELTTEEQKEIIEKSLSKIESTIFEGRN